MNITAFKNITSSSSSERVFFDEQHQIQRAPESFWGRNIQLAVFGRSDLEKQQNREATNHWLNAATKEFGHEVMNFAMPPAEQKLRLEQGLPLSPHTIHQTNAKASQTYQAAETYVEEHPELDTSVARTLGIIKHAQKEFDTAVAAYEKSPTTPEILTHLRDAAAYALSAIPDVPRLLISTSMHALGSLSSHGPGALTPHIMANMIDFGRGSQEEAPDLLNNSLDEALQALSKYHEVRNKNGIVAEANSNVTTAVTALDVAISDLKARAQIVIQEVKKALAEEGGQDAVEFDEHDMPTNPHLKRMFETTFAVADASVAAAKISGSQAAKDIAPQSEEEDEEPHVG